MLLVYKSMAKLTDTQKDKGHGSFANFVRTKTICKDPWGRHVRYIPFELTQCSCMCYGKIISSID